MTLSKGLERKFRIHTGNAVFCKYLGSWKESNPGSWKESWQGSWKELKMNLFGDSFWITGSRELKFCRLVRTWCTHLLTKFGVSAANSLWVITVFVIKIYWPRFAHAWCQWSLGASWVGFGGKVLISMVDATFGRKPANGTQKPWICCKNTMVLKGNLFDTIGANCPWFW